MNVDFTSLDEMLSERGLDGYLLDADSDLADQRYLSGFDAPDPFVTLYTPETSALLVSTLEYGRAKDESRADEVRQYADFDRRALVDEYGETEGHVRTIRRFLDEFDVDGVATNERFPLETADYLRELGLRVRPDSTDTVEKIRAVKTQTEIKSVRETQRANEAAMATAERLFTEATVDDGVLQYEGEPLTSERVRRAIETTLLDHGCGLDETIVAAGREAASPHDRGSGPIPADEPVVVDIFPRNRETGYHADMTRTFLVGTPSEAVAGFHELTREAKRAALETVEAGVTGGAVHDAACRVYEEEGFPTLRTAEGTERGYIHNTGHGVGLEVHERPRLARNGEELEAGNVVTVEPGLYDPDVGGVRIEDLVVVTEDGYENLTDYHETLVV
ncbi:MAG: M24 family metallopeptidase [Halanaeroarchaeum sp.]